MKYLSFPWYIIFTGSFEIPEISLETPSGEQFGGTPVPWVPAPEGRFSSAGFRGLSNPDLGHGSPGPSARSARGPGL